MPGTLWKEFSKGLWKELPPFRLVLGLCPVLAVTKSASTGLGMGMAVIFVLALSNMIISLVRNMIPQKVRIACFIVISASLVVAVELLMQAYAYPLYQSLGIFVPLIVVNCIILGRAEAFAGKKSRTALPGRRVGHGAGLYAFPHLSRSCPGTVRRGHTVRRTSHAFRIRAVCIHGGSARRICMPRPHSGVHELS